MMDAIFGAPSIFFDDEQLELNKLFSDSNVQKESEYKEI